MIGLVTGHSIEPNKDGTINRVMLQVQFSPGDVKTVELMQGQGEDFNPALTSRVFVVEAADSYKLAVAGSDNIPAESDPGEKEIYSSDPAGTTKLARVKLHNDGLIEIKNLVESYINILEDFISEIQGLQLVSSAVMPGSIAALEAIKVRAKLLFK